MSRRFRFSRHALALAVALPLVAQSATVSLTAVENLGSTVPGSATNVMTPALANGGDFFRSNSDGSGNTSFFHTYGTTGGVNYFGARTSGSGTFYTKTSATYADSFSNTSLGSVTAVFAFNVDSGQVGLGGSGTGFADLLLTLQVSLDGGATWTTAAGEHGRVNYDSGGSTSCIDSDGGSVGVLSAYLSCGSPTSSMAVGSGGSYSISQVLAAGQTMQVMYSIVAEVSGTLIPSTAITDCPVTGDPTHQGQTLGKPNAGNGVVGTDTPPTPGGAPTSQPCYANPFNGIARSGDPAGFTAQPVGAANNGFLVPEPASRGLVALSLAGLALSLRRRR